MNVTMQDGAMQNYGYLCGQCLAGEFVTCNKCGDWFHNEWGKEVVDENNVSYGFMCYHCRFEDFKRCKSCGTLVRKEDITSGITSSTMRCANDECEGREMVGATGPDEVPTGLWDQWGA